MSSSGKGSSRGGPLKNDGKSSHSGAPVQGGSRNPPPGGNPTVSMTDRTQCTLRIDNHQNPSTSTANSSSIPHLLSLIIKIEPLSPNYGNDGQSPRRTREGYFLPPNRTNGYERGNGPAILLRWMGGRLVPIAQDDEIRHIALHVYRYRTATVFTQNEDTPHLLAVPFDARERNVPDEINGWRPLTFNHERIPGTDRYYSYISCVGAETGIAATGSAHWMPQLLPGWYQYRPRTSATRVQAGLIGNLPLLFALAAFSTPPTPAGLNVLARSLQPGAWNPHANPYPSGRGSRFSIL